MTAIQSPNIKIMLRAAEKAARSLIRDFGEVEQLQVSRKGPADFVSAADRRAEEIIHENLLRDRPDYAFLMEESGNQGSDDYQYRWIIDPLDGTTNFLHGIPHWAISIGLEERKGGKSEIIAGLVADPVKDEWFTAEKGTGAFSKRKRLRVSGRTTIDTCLIAGGSPTPSWRKDEKFLKDAEVVFNKTSGYRELGSSALNLAYVAAGRFDGCWERNLSPWDVAAGYLLIKEAGGFVEPIVRGEDPVFSGNLIAGNQSIREFLMKLPQ